MFVYLCGYNTDYFKNKCILNNNIIITDSYININDYELYNFGTIIYIYNNIDNESYINYEIKLDTINCKVPIYKINGTDDETYIILCLNKILKKISSE
jgi:hypothetical protein